MTSESPDGDNAPLLGQVVAERYFVEKHLGEGGMGTVYRARHITLEKPVALKVLHGEFSRKQELVDRFLQEARAASRIRNAHVIDITDFGVTGDGYVFFAMEYLEGKDLHGLLKETTDGGNLLPWDRALDIFLQICEALAAAHAEGIIHRDLKPENIFLVAGTGRSDYVKLLDFGIAKVESTGGGAEGERKLTKTGMLFGTPEYMAPEQARGEKPDHRVDVYAMGCLLFQLLTGTVPFKAESFMAILTQHMVEPVPDISIDLLARSGAPREILAVVHRALEKDRDMRYSSMVELAAAVFDASGGGLPSEASPTERHRISRPTYSAGDWTGAVRQIDEIDEQSEKINAPAPGAAKAKSKWLVAGLAAVGLAGAGVAAIVLSGSEKAASEAVPAESDPQAAPERNATAEHPALQHDASVSGPGEIDPDTATPVDRAGRDPSDSTPGARQPDRQPDRQPEVIPDKTGGKKSPAEAARPAGKDDERASPAADEPKGEPESTPAETKTPGDDAPGEVELLRPPGL